MGVCEHDNTPCFVNVREVAAKMAGDCAMGQAVSHWTSPFYLSARGICAHKVALGQVFLRALRAEIAQSV